MENAEVFMYVFVISHYTFTLFFVSWLFEYGKPTELSNYGLFL